MRRMLVITVLAMLLLATVGTTAAAAVKSPKSPVYQFNVLGINGSPKGEASGKLIVNTNANTFAFNGRHGAPSTSYDLYYVIGTEERKFATGTADEFGNVAMSGQLPTLLPAGATWKDVTGAGIKLTPFQVTLTATRMDMGTYWYIDAYVTWSHAPAPEHVRGGWKYIDFSSGLTWSTPYGNDVPDLTQPFFVGGGVPKTWGTPVSMSVTLTARDSSGTIVTAYSNTVNFV